MVLGKRKVWNALFRGGLIAVTFTLAAVQLHASVVVAVGSERANQETVLSFGMRVVEADASSSSGDVGTSLAIEGARETGPAGPSPAEVQISASNVPRGMLPSSASLSQVGSGVGGAAVEREIEILPHDSLRAILTPESRTVLPTGPVFRWFRPPRVWL